MKPIRVIPFLAGIAFLWGVFSSCKKTSGCIDPDALNYDPIAVYDDGSCEYCECCGSGNCGVGYLTGTITSNTTLTNDVIYVLAGHVVVASGVTLTIEPGTIFKGEEGTGTMASCLIIERGAKINAVGTASQPIIFTSVLDNIQLGDPIGTNLDENDKGFWGGLLILGNAPISSADGDTESYVEGFPVSGSYGFYGGNDANDNSGALAYVSIRHTGASIGAGVNTPGLFLGGVGSGTSISNLECVAGEGDGLVVFGGTVNTDNVIIGFPGDDGIDIDQNYDGVVDNFRIITSGVISNAVEADGPEGATYTDGVFELMNGTVGYQGTDIPRSSFKGKAKGVMTNIDFAGNLKLGSDYTNNCNDLAESCLYYLLESTPELVFSSCKRMQIEFYTGACPVQTADSLAAQNAIPSVAVSGASTSGWEWTWMSAKGFL